MSERKSWSVLVACLLWFMLMIVLCTREPSYGGTRLRNVAASLTFATDSNKVQAELNALRKQADSAGADSALYVNNGQTVKSLEYELSHWRIFHPPTEPHEIDIQFQYAYRAANKTKPWTVTTSATAMLDFYFMRLFQDAGLTKYFTVTSNTPGDLDRYFNIFYELLP